MTQPIIIAICITAPALFIGVLVYLYGRNKRQLGRLEHENEQLVGQESFADSFSDPLVTGDDLLRKWDEIEKK